MSAAGKDQTYFFLSFPSFPFSFLSISLSCSVCRMRVAGGWSDSKSYRLVCVRLLHFCRSVLSSKKVMNIECYFCQFFFYIFCHSRSCRGRNTEMAGINEKNTIYILNKCSGFIMPLFCINLVSVSQIRKVISLQVPSSE